MIPILRLATAVLFILPQIALADIPTVPGGWCGTLPGCGQGPANVLFRGIVPLIVSLMVNVAAAGGIVLIIWAGFKLLFSKGEEGVFGKAKWAIIYALGGFALALGSESVVNVIARYPWGAGGGDTLFGPNGLFGLVIGLLFFVFNFIFLLVIMFAGYVMVVGGGNAEEYKRGFTMLRHAIIGAAIANLSYALVQGVLGLGI